MDSNDRGLVAITGANGTIGYACVLYALQVGYRVRCIVRRAEAITIIKSGPSIQKYLDRVDFTIVSDNAVAGAYDRATRGVKYVVHTAGAWPLQHLHPDNDIYLPFLDSMECMLQGVKRSGTVKRVVFTQAAAGLVDSEDGDTLGTRMDKVLDEHVEINQASLSYRPPMKSAHNAYCAAKAQCMKSLDDLRVSNSEPYSIVQIIPGTVIGTSEFATTASQALAQMDRQTKALLFDEMKPRYAFGFVHVEDCARIHIEALDEDKVKSEDLPPWFVAAATTQEGFNGGRTWSEAINAMAKEFKNEINQGIFKLGRSKMPINMPYRVDSKFTESMLFNGQKIRGLEESAKEVAHWYIGMRNKEQKQSVRKSFLPSIDC